MVIRVVPEQDLQVLAGIRVQVGEGGEGVGDTLHRAQPGGEGAHRGQHLTEQVDAGAQPVARVQPIIDQPNQRGHAAP